MNRYFFICHRKGLRVGYCTVIAESLFQAGKAAKEYCKEKGIEVTNIRCYKAEPFQIPGVVNFHE